MKELKQAVNPYLPLYEYVPDGEPRVFDGRAYIYGSHDFAGGEKYCMGDYVTWSAPVDDLSEWRYEGVIYKRTQDPSNAENRLDLWAPDVVRGVDGKYYMYYCFSFYPEIGVAVSNSPAGPFNFYGHVKYSDSVLGGKALQEDFPFDPGVLVDEDGRVFLYYGFSPAQKLTPPPKEALIGSGMTEEEAETELARMSNAVFSKGAMVVELESDMLTMKGKPELFIPGGLIADGTTFEGHGFFEAASMRKINNTYYFIYSSQLSHELCYAASQYPDHDFTYGGTIVSNGDIGYYGNQSPKGMMGNNHGSIMEIDKKWYVFYHRQTHGTESSRQGCAEQLVIRNDGTIPQVEMTSCGLNGAPLIAQGTYSAAIACNLICASNGRKIIYGQSLKELQPYIFEEKTGKSEAESVHYIANMMNQTVAGYKYFKCEQVSEIQVCIRGTGEGILKVLIDSENGKVVGSIHVNGVGETWETISVPVEIPDGVHGLFFKYTGKNAIDFKEFTFV